MKKYISGLSLLGLGLILFFAYLFFAGSAESSFGDFSDGFLLGLSLGIILVGIILIVVIAIKSKRENKKWVTNVTHFFYINCF